MDSCPYPNLLRLGEIDWPVVPEAIFGRRAKLVVEVGFGNGQFLEDMARVHPEWNLLGVEIAPASVTRAWRRLRRAAMAHVKVMRGQAAFVVRELCPPRGLHRVFVNFPDPWPKEKHEERRLLRQPFFRLLSTRLEPEGALLLTTDHEEYFRFSVEQAEATGLFRITEGSPPAEMLRTKYAQRWLGLRKSIFHGEFRKQAEDPDRHRPRVEVVDMQHIRLKGSLDGIGGFEKTLHRFETGQVVLKNCYRGLDGRVLIFLCIVDEDDLRQEVLVEARPSASGIFVALMGFGAPVITRGVRESVRAVAGWLRQQGLELIEEAV